MKIVFICGALEEGMDGIGDYTRKLSHECSISGISCVAVAVNDRFISEVVSDIHEKVSFYRIPASFSWKKKEMEVTRILSDHSPFGWLSIQFISYGYNSKGIVFNAIPFFRRICKDRNVQVMMHELWNGEQAEAPLKLKIVGKIQKWSILSFLRSIRPRIIHTSIPLYSALLKRAGVENSVLPLFSNISSHNPVIEDYADKIPDYLFRSREDYLVGCLFGSIYHQSWDLSSLFKMLNTNGSHPGKQLVIASIGRIGAGSDFWNQLTTRYQNIKFLLFGQQDEEFISHWLDKYVDFGILTTPVLIAGKSGSFMAFKEHGIPVFGKENSISFSYPLPGDLYDEHVVQIGEESVFKYPGRTEKLQQLKNTAAIFLASLNKKYI